MRRSLRAFGGVAGVSLLSQVAAAGAVLSIALLGPDAADAYAIGLQIGTATLAGYSIGVIYNLGLGRPSFDAWGRAKLGAVASAVLLGLIILGVTEIIAATEVDPIIVLAFAVGSAGLGVAGVRGAQLACMGQPLPLARTTIPSNIAMSLTAVVTLVLAPEATYGPAFAWSSVAVLQGFLALRRVSRTEIHNLTTRDHSDGQMRIHLAGLIVGSVVASVAPTLYLTAIAQLASGVAGLVFVVWRLLSSVVNVGVNSLLLVAYNWASRPVRLEKFAAGIALAGPLPVAAGIVSHAFNAPDLITYVLILIGLAFYLVASAMTVRSANANSESRAILTKALVDAALSAIAVVVLFVWPSVSGFFGAYLVSQGVTIAVLGFAKRDYLRGTAGTIAVALSIPLLALGW